MTICILAQPILIEEMVEVDGLICFPVIGDTSTYKYLPSNGRLALNKENYPEFSFLQYAFENNQNERSSSSITDAIGGGLLHFLVLYETPSNTVRRAERRLRTKLKNKELKLVGPVDISSGQFLLVSSVLINGEEERQLIGTGKAPVFQNSKVAFSFMLDPIKSQILMESFKMTTPDISIVFDLGFKGLTSAYSGKLTVDWSQVQRSSYSNKSVDAIFYSSDVEKTFGELIQTGAVKMESYGRDSIASDLLDLAYDRLLKLMFDPTRPDSIEEEDTGGWIEDVFGNRGLGGSLIGGSNVYKSRTIKTSGTTTVDISSRKMVDRHHFVTFNIGDLYKDYGDNDRVFKKVVPDNEIFKQREVFVNLDGSIREEFDEMISSVSVTLKKEHKNGDETVREVFFDTELLKDYEGSPKLIYMNKEDADKEKWLEYNYSINWQFRKDGTYQTDWYTANTPIINLYAPYKYHQIDILGDLKKLNEEEVVAVVIQVEYPFFGKIKKERLIIKPFLEEQENVLKTVLPNEVMSVKYEITWVYKNGKKIQFDGLDEIGIILIDEIPSSE